MTKTKLASAADVKNGQSLKFQVARRGARPLNGFLARFKGQLVAYENLCRHLPLPLDYGDGKFFSREGDHFVCQTHNAIYDPLTGLCVRGPCEGEHLKPLKIEEIEGEVWLMSGQ